MQVDRDELWLCADCAQIASNGIRGTGFENTPFGERVLARLSQDQFANLVPNFDTDTNDGFDLSNSCCEVCGTTDGGTRVRFATLKY